MVDLKNKFMDILFEDDPETEETDSENIGEKASVSSNDATINVKDILYRKSDSSPFINLEETVISNKSDTEEHFDKAQEYELSAQISPIFGVIKKAERKTTVVSEDIIKSQTTKPSDTHLDIITSPIYGYGNKEDAMDNNYDVKGVGEESNDEEAQLHDLFDVNEAREDYDVMSNDILDDDDISLFKLFGDNK